MRTLIPIFIGLLIVGCGTVQDIGVHRGIGKPITLTMKSAAGTYVATIDGDTGNLVLLANGKVKFYDGNGEKDKEGTWKLVEKEVHIEEVTDILKIEPNGNLTIIALIEDGKRTDFPKDEQITLGKIK